MLRNCTPPVLSPGSGVPNVSAKLKMKQIFGCKIRHITLNTTKIIISCCKKSPANCIPTVLLAVSVVSHVSATKKVTNNNEDNKNKNHC